MGVTLLRGVLDKGATVHFYSDFTREKLPAEIREDPNLHLVHTPSPWRWNQWYSNTAMSAFVTGNVSRMRVYNKAVDKLVRNHAVEPYDAVFQLSQPELLKMGRLINSVPPLVIYPCSHAAGELRWHRKEAQLGVESEGLLKHYAARVMLKVRARRQRRDLRLPQVIAGPSGIFNRLVQEDYDLPAEKFEVLRHPIRPVTTEAPLETDRKLRLAYVARLSVRKGLEMIIDLSNRLADMHERIEIVAVGGPSQWSDYRKHLVRLNPLTARYMGELSHQEMTGFFYSCDALLLPSHYEPGALVVGEALAHGVPVVVSDAVGPSECLEQDCCRSFASGNVDEFEAQVRRLVRDMELDGARIRAVARRQANAHFAPEKIAGELLQILRRAARESECAR